jgi:hypothetical protein
VGAGGILAVSELGEGDYGGRHDLAVLLVAAARQMVG